MSTIICAKVGKKFVKFGEDGKVTLTTKADEAIYWPMEMELQVREGMETLEEMGFKVRLEFMEV